MLAPAELLPRPSLTLERWEWRSMPAPAMVLSLGALIGVVLFGPALLLAALRGLLGELALLAALLIPSFRLLFGPETPTPRTPRLPPAPPRLSLTAVGQWRRGRVRAIGGRTVATLVRARDRRGTYLWRQNAGEFDLIGADGRSLRVCGALSLDGKVQPLAEAPPALPLPPELPAVGELELLELCDGDEVELRGPSPHEQAAAGYRDAVEVMRGVPGDPVEIRRL